MNLFLQGPIGIGKSTLLRDALAPFAALTAGFITQRLLEDNNKTGYRCVVLAGILPALEASPATGDKNVFLLKGRRDVSVLEQAILQVERDLQKHTCRLIVLDEIGGIELKSGVFTKSLARILRGKKPCVGVLKSAENLAHTRAMLNLEAEYLSLHNDLERMIRATGELLTVSKDNREALREYLTKYLQSVL